MDEVILHIGTHKTGTTTLQTCLSAARDSLEREYSILYPVCGIPDSECGQHELAWSIQRKKGMQPDKYWRALQDELFASRARQAVISSEVFWTSSSEQIEEIANYLQGLKVRILLFLRNEVGLMVSIYKQYVKSGWTSLTFKAFCSEQLHLVDYGAPINGWSRQFGDDNLTVVSYDQCQLGGGVEAPFLKTLGLPWTQFAGIRQERKNVSPDELQVKAVQRTRQILEVCGIRSGSLTHRLRRHILRGTRLGNALITLAGNRSTPMLDEETRELIVAAAARHNRQVLEARFSAEERRHFSEWKDTA